MAVLKIWFLDVGHGDSAYLGLPNGARMMIDCGAGPDHWPSRLLKHYKLTKDHNPAPIPNHPTGYALDNLVITHPHADHIADIGPIHDDIGFFLLTGSYRGFIDQISIDQIDFRKRGQQAARKFIEVVKKYRGQYNENEDRVAMAKPTCTVKKKRFIEYDQGMDLNELSWFVSVEMGAHKVLFTGDMTATGVEKILQSNQAKSFREFVAGTSILKIPHHGRENGCSQTMFDAFGKKPILCIASDEVLSDKNEGTSNVQWYSDRTSDTQVKIDEKFQSRKVLTTRKDGDIFVEISDKGELRVVTHSFKELRAEILRS